MKCETKSFDLVGLLNKENYMLYVVNDRFM